MNQKQISLLEFLFIDVKCFFSQIDKFLEKLNTFFFGKLNLMIFLNIEGEV